MPIIQLGGVKKVYYLDEYRTEEAKDILAFSNIELIQLIIP